ncbi:MAG: hypothetical protein C0506_06660 [Anaerolinea sp.]|nr:hypothetical protein [Anaerolinea sp.]
MLTDQWQALGNLIRLAREAKAMNQDELGRRVGTSRPTISLLETGQIKFPKIPMLTAIAKALDIPAPALFAELGVSPDDAAPGQLHWLASQLDPQHLRMLIAIGHALLQEQHDQLQMGERRAARP